MQEKCKLKYDLSELVKARKDVTVAAEAKVLDRRLRSRRNAEDRQAAQRKKPNSRFDEMYPRRRRRRFNGYEIDSERNSPALLRRTSRESLNHPCRSDDAFDSVISMNTDS